MLIPVVVGFAPTIVEISTAGSCDETVLARKAMMIPFTAAPISATTAQQFEIEINNSSATLDDYVAWSPTPSRIRWANGTSPTATTMVTLRNMAGTNHLRFAGGTLPGGSTAAAANVTLTLNGDGSWTNFFVAGCSDNLISSPPCSPSSADKDAVLEVRDASNNVLTREGLMVRLRKNANILSPAETARYLEALGKVNMTYALNNADADYFAFVRTHSRDSSGSVGSGVAHRQAHGGSGFLPWHRAFVLHIERLLQSADPSVALPYWKFDDDAPDMFMPTFMGHCPSCPELESSGARHTETAATPPSSPNCRHWVSAAADSFSPVSGPWNRVPTIRRIATLVASPGLADPPPSPRATRCSFSSTPTSTACGRSGNGSTIEPTPALRACPPTT